MLGRLPVGPGQAQRPVGGVRAGAPDLRAVEDEDVAVARGPGGHAGQVGPAARLGQELHHDLVAADDGRQVLALLLLGAHVEHGRPADRERGDVEDQRHLVAGALLVEGLLMGPGQTQAAVLPRKADAGEAAVVEQALQLAGPGPDLVAPLHHGLETVALAGNQPRHVRRPARPGLAAGRTRRPQPAAPRSRVCHRCPTQPPRMSASAPAVLAGCPEHRPVHRRPPQVQVDVVLPGHADAAVHLHAVLDDVGRALPDVGLGHAGQLVGVVGPRAGGVRRGAGRGLAGLEPQLHVRETVLERLVGGERPAEGVPVERPLRR